MGQYTFHSMYTAVACNYCICGAESQWVHYKILYNCIRMVTKRENHSRFQCRRGEPFWGERWRRFFSRRMRLKLRKYSKKSIESVFLFSTDTKFIPWLLNTRWKKLFEFNAIIFFIQSIKLCMSKKNTQTENNFCSVRALHLWTKSNAAAAFPVISLLKQFRLRMILLRESFSIHLIIRTMNLARRMNFDQE